ncbi:MAG: MotA/TolQ/ExbB proton channel family protein [Marinifilaceae bacterium]
MEQVAPIATAVQESISVWDMMIKGGWLMIPIFIISIITIFIFIERFFAIKKYTALDNGFIQSIVEQLERNYVNDAIKHCGQTDSPSSRVILKGLTHRELPVSEIRPIMEGAANLEVAQMERGLSTLATCAAMAPMIGFLGTVIGMIQAFYDMAMAGSNINITLLSRGIYTAMVTTVAGLIVGIIAQFAYNMLVSRINKMVNKMEYNNNEFIEAIYQQRENCQKA